MRRALRVAVGLSVSAVCVYMMTIALDWQAFLQSVKQARPAWLSLGLVFLALDYALRLYRWHWMLRAVGSPVGFAGCARPFLVGVALNNLLPLRAGDVARAVAFRRTLVIPVSKVVATLLVERLLDLMVVLAIVGLSLVLLSPRVPGLADGLWPAPDRTVVAVFALVLLGLMAASRIAARTRVGEDLVFRASSWLRNLRDALVLFSRPRAMGGLLGLSVVIWSLEGGVFAAVAWSLHMNTSGTWLAMGMGSLGTALPGSPGHIGTFDFFTMAGMMLAGAGRAAATAYAVLVHVLLWLPLTIAGVWAMLLRVGMPDPEEDSRFV